MDKQDKPKVVPITRAEAVKLLQVINNSEQYGVFDTYDCFWMGNDKGPLVLATCELAEIACSATEIMLGWPAGRCRARVYTGGAPKLRDTLKTVCSGAEAIDRLEKGAV